MLSSHGSTTGSTCIDFIATWIDIWGTCIDIIVTLVDVWARIGIRVIIRTYSDIKMLSILSSHGSTSGSTCIDFIATLVDIWGHMYRYYRHIGRHLGAHVSILSPHWSTSGAHVSIVSSHCSASGSTCIDFIATLVDIWGHMYRYYRHMDRHLGHMYRYYRHVGRRLGKNRY
jgi:hypothetical protein